MGQGADPKLSVVVTCYNLGGYLEEALASIPMSEQVEVIVVDDGSTDPATVAVLDRLDTGRYRVIRQVNMGLAAARNNGIRLARAPYIVPLDADNRLRPAMVERAVKVLDEQPGVDIVYGDAEYFGERQGRWILGAYNFAELIERNRIDACAAFRKALWERVGGYDEHMPVMGYEDWDFWLRCSVAGATFHYDDAILFDYRVRDGSMISNTMKNRPLLIAYIFDKPELRFLAPLRSAYLEALHRLKNPPVLTGRQLLAMLLQRLRERFFGLSSFIMEHW